MKTTKPVKTYTSADFATWGAEGGRGASGAKKRQPKAHYERIALLGVAARQAKRALQSKPQKA